MRLILCALHVLNTSVIIAKALSIMRYQNDINTEHNMKSICCAAVAQLSMRLTRNGQTRIQIRKADTFLILQFSRFSISNF